MAAPLVWLAACGGGGGGGGGGGSVAPAPSGPGPSIAAPTGRLWHHNYALDFLDGTQIASATGGPPMAVTPEAEAIPWPDGSQYVTAEWDLRTDRTAVRVHATASGAVLHEAAVDQYFRAPRPAPHRKEWVLGRVSDSVTTAGVYAVIDLAARRVLDQFPADDAAVDWLPDGRYVHVTHDGRISIGTVGVAARQAVGQLALPRGLTVNEVWADPQGRRLALRLWSKSEAGTIDVSDLWVSDLDGRNAYRHTQTRMTNRARWSPDGRLIAFDVDTGSLCDFSGCVGHCELWYADADAREVTALPAAGDARQFRVRNRSGQERVLGCDLLGWTP